MKPEPKPFCVVCGAKSRVFQDTCDSICTRAKRGKKSRGSQIELEIRAEWRKPIPERDFTPRDFLENDGSLYNRPYLIDSI